MVRKKLNYLAEHPINVLGVSTRKNWRGKTQGVPDSDLMEVLVEQVAEFEVHYVIILDKHFKSSKKKMKNIEDSLIYGNEE